jgi:type IV pilus assembly protein PilC
VKRSTKLAHFIDRLSLKIPVVGQILHNSAIARFARTLAVTFKAGVPLVEALDTVAGAPGSVVYGEAVRRIRDDVAVGYQLNMAMRQVDLFPNMVTQMTAIGEEAGALDTMLFKVAAFYVEPARAFHHGDHRRRRGRHGHRHVPADLQARRGDLTARRAWAG